MEIQRSWLTQAERRARAEQALLEAAAELIATHGMSKASLAAICKRAGYSHGLANYHFGSKQGLIDALADRCQECFVAGLHNDGGVRTRTGLESLLAIADAYVDAFACPTPMTRCFALMWGASFVEDAEVDFARFDRRFRAGIGDLVKLGQRDGSVRQPVDPEAFAGLMLALLRGIGAQMLTSLGDVSPTRIKRECGRIVCNSLCAPAMHETEEVADAERG